MPQSYNLKEVKKLNENVQGAQHNERKIKNPLFQLKAQNDNLNNKKETISKNFEEKQLPQLVEPINPSAQPKNLAQINDINQEKLNNPQNNLKKDINLYRDKQLQPQISALVPFPAKNDPSIKDLKNEPNYLKDNQRYEGSFQLQPQISPLVPFPAKNDFQIQELKNGTYALKENQKKEDIFQLQHQIFPQIPFPVKNEFPIQQLKNETYALKEAPKKENIFDIRDLSKLNDSNQNQVNNSINPFSNQFGISNQNSEMIMKDNYNLSNNELIKERNNNLLNEKNFPNPIEFVNSIMLNPNEEEKKRIENSYLKNPINQKDLSNPSNTIPLSKPPIATSSNLSQLINPKANRNMNLSFYNQDLQIKSMSNINKNELQKNSILNFESDYKDLGVQKCNSCKMKSKFKTIFYPCNCEVYFCSNPECYELLEEIEKANNLLKKDNLFCIKCNKPFLKFAKLSFFDVDKFFEKKVKLK